ncbi:hypothetical protein TrispH2_002982 [Trichoplax sp. H2]|nr:hypothetical protein TrispH2_002982 [Trichoplax sp. H2]|eukprot:RDD45081.1 hypothetical protein TrispH2_002982 [Trichoplax sp. H2]
MAILPDNINVDSVLDEIVQSMKNVHQLDKTKQLVYQLDSKSIIDKIIDPLSVATKIIQIVQNHYQTIGFEWLYPLLQFARENVIFSNLNDIIGQENQQRILSTIGCVENLKEKMLKLIKDWNETESYKMTDNLPPYPIYAELDILYQLLHAILNQDPTGLFQKIHNVYNKCFDIIESVLIYDCQRLIALVQELKAWITTDLSYVSHYIYLDIMNKIIGCSYCSFNQREFTYSGGQIYYLDGSVFVMEPYYSIWNVVQKTTSWKSSTFQSNIILQKGITDTIKIFQSIKLPIKIKDQIKVDLANMMSQLSHPYLDYLIWYHRQPLAEIVHDDLLAKLTLLELSPKYSGMAVQLSELEFIPLLTQLPTIINLPSSKETLIQRHHYFNQIYHEMDVQGHHSMVLSGLAGVGKSSLALHYARSHTIHYNCIHWFHAETELSLQHDFIKLAKAILRNKQRFHLEKKPQLDSIRDCLDQFTENSELLQSVGDNNIIIASQLKTCDEQRIDLINKLVQATLDFILGHYCFLLIYDNADQEEIVRRYMPQRQGHGLVLLTSRYANWGDVEKINIDLFQRQESIDYLLQRTNSEDKESADLVANRICDLPLALSQAVAYIQRTGISLSGYHARLMAEENDIAQDSYSSAYYKKYQQVDSGQIKLSQQLTPLTTWSSTFSQLVTNNPSIQSMFMLIAYIQVDQLTDNLLFEFCQLQDPNTKREDYNNAICGLNHYHVLHGCPEGSLPSYKTNKLIQMAIRNHILEIVSTQLGHSLGDWIYVQDIILCRILVYFVDKLSHDEWIESDDQTVGQSLNLIYHADQLRQHLLNSELLSHQRLMLEEKMTKMYTTITNPLSQLEMNIMAKIETFKMALNYRSDEDEGYDTKFADDIDVDRDRDSSMEQANVSYEDSQVSNHVLRSVGGVSGVEIGEEIKLSTADDIQEKSALSLSPVQQDSDYFNDSDVIQDSPGITNESNPNLQLAAQDLTHTTNTADSSTINESDPENSALNKLHLSDDPLLILELVIKEAEVVEEEITITNEPNVEINETEAVGTIPEKNHGQNHSSPINTSRSDDIANAEVAEDALVGFYEEDIRSSIEATADISEAAQDNNATTKMNENGDNLSIAKTTSTSTTDPRRVYSQPNVNNVAAAKFYYDPAPNVKRDRSVSDLRCTIFPIMKPAATGYPQKSITILANKTNCFKLKEAPGVQLTITPSCFQIDTSATISVFYADPPYNKGLNSGCIQMAPIVRIKCDDITGQQSTRFPFSLQIPVPLAEEICLYLSVKKINELPVQILHRRHEPDSEWELLDSKFTYFVNDHSCPCISFNMHYFADVTFVLDDVLSTMQQISQDTFPSFQQHIRLWSYVSLPRKGSTRSIMKLIIAKTGLGHISILDAIENNPNFIPLEATGLDDFVVRNGSYRLHFVPISSACGLIEDFPVYTAFDWNNRNYFAFDIKCRLKDPASNNGNLGKLCLSQVSEERTVHECNLIMPQEVTTSLELIQSPPPEVEEVAGEDLKSHLEFIASQNIDLDKLAAKLDNAVRLSEAGRKLKSKSDKVRVLLKIWKESNEPKANLNQLTKALGAMNKGDVVKRIAETQADLFARRKKAKETIV